MSDNHNILFVCIARVAGHGIVLASHAHHTEVELDSVKQVLEQPNMNMNAGKHYSFPINRFSWNLITVMCLEELQSSFVATVGDRAMTAGERSLDKQCSHLLLKICKKYDNLAEVDKVASVVCKVETVKLKMQENVDAALQNCVKLEHIEKAAEDLQLQARGFSHSARELKNKLWWKNMKMKLMFACIALVIVGIIIAIAVTMSQAGN